MVSRNVIVANRLGLHARAAAKLVQLSGGKHRLTLRHKVEILQIKRRAAAF